MRNQFSYSSKQKSSAFKGSQMGQRICSLLSLYAHKKRIPQDEIATKQLLPIRDSYNIDNFITMRNYSKSNKHLQCYLHTLIARIKSNLLLLAETVMYGFAVLISLLINAYHLAAGCRIGGYALHLIGLSIGRIPKPQNAVEWVIELLYLLRAILCVLLLVGIANIPMVVFPVIAIVIILLKVCNRVFNKRDN